MRPLTALAVAALLASAYFAKAHYDRRAGMLGRERFVTADPLARIRDGSEGRRLGVELAGLEDVVQRNPGDLEALRERIRVAMTVGAVAYGETGLEDFVKSQTDAYFERRNEIDPDGSFARSIAEAWVAERLRFRCEHRAGFYARASTAIYLAARGDPAGRETLLAFVDMAPFYTEFFPFVRRFHPGWPAVEPLVVRYLQDGNLSARIEAGVTLLDYHALFGVGAELVARHRQDIHEAVKEVRDRMRRTAVDEVVAVSGHTAVLGMALLANLGEAGERRLLEATRDERELRHYAPFVDTVRVARLWVGLDPFASLDPLSERFKDMDPRDQELYYIAAAQRAALLQAEGGGDLAGLLDLLEAAFDGPIANVRIFAMQALSRLAPERGAALVERAVRARGTLSIYGGALAERIDDPIANFLPALRSPEPDVAALAAVSLLEGRPHLALQK